MSSRRTSLVLISCQTVISFCGSVMFQLENDIQTAMVIVEWSSLCSW